MAANNIFTQSVRYGSTLLSYATTYSGTLQTQVVNESIADSSVDTLIEFTLQVASVQSFYLVSDADVLVEFNSGSAPTPAISLLAGVPYMWTLDSYDAFLLTVDITPGMYVTNASGGPAVINMIALSDATP